MNVEADFFEIKPQEVDLYRVAAELVFDLGVLDAGVELFEVLCLGSATENTEGEHQQAVLRESDVEILGHSYLVLGSRSRHLLTRRF